MSNSYLYKILEECLIISGFVHLHQNLQILTKEFNVKSLIHSIWRGDEVMTKAHLGISLRDEDMAEQ